jgi:hypothetical protein
MRQRGSFSHPQHDHIATSTGQQVLQGKNLLVCRAGNKGAVCLPFRLHQSTLVVAAAHLPADGSRGSKVGEIHACVLSSKGH